MTTPQDVVWDIQPHTLAKHTILRRYLGAWFPILASRNPRMLYIDGFCGPGRYRGGEPGSPIIALEEALKHRERLKRTQVVFLLVDENPENIAHLQRELCQLDLPSNFTIRSEAGPFVAVLPELLADIEAASQTLPPAFVFIDPFGFKGLPLHLMQRLLAIEKTEILVNFMVEAVNRWLRHPQDQIRQHIVELFGTDDVLRIAQEPGDRIVALRSLYQRQLSRYARFVRSFEMRDSRNKPIYYLFFAGNHPLGHVRMKDAFWTVDPTSGFSFSDATDPAQLVLFEKDETPTLAASIAKAFARRRTLVKSVRQYVEDETPFIATHMRAALRWLEDHGKAAVREHKRGGEKRRAGSYPDDAIIEFP